MSLNAHQKDALAIHLAALLEHNEPHAFFATLYRIAERQAFHEMRRDHFAVALNWQEIADTLARVRAELYPSQSSSKSPNTCP